MSAKTNPLIYAAIAIGIIAIVLSGLSFATDFTAAPASKVQRFTVFMGEQMVIGETEAGDVEVGEFHRWEPGVITVQKGDTVVIDVTNPRKSVHSFVLPAFNVDTGDLEPRGGSATVQFTADKAGVFKFQCGIPPTAEGRCNIDHEFMVGYLVVTE